MGERVKVFSGRKRLKRYGVNIENTLRDCAMA